MLFLLFFAFCLIGHVGAKRPNSLLSIAIPTIKIPDALTTPKTPYHLPYPLPTNVAPIPFLDEDQSLACDVCQNFVVVLRARLATFEESFKPELEKFLKHGCELIAKLKPIEFLEQPCLLIENRLTSTLFSLITTYESYLTPSYVCGSLSLCKK